MNLKRNGALLGALAVGATRRSTACGSDNNSAFVQMSTRPRRPPPARARPTCPLPARPHRRTRWTSSSPPTSPCASRRARTVNVAYNPSGSGDGRTQFIASQIDFAGSDSAIKGEQAEQATARCVGNDAWNLPLVFGPVAVAYNLDGVDNLVLNAETIAKIFNGWHHQLERSGHRRAQRRASTCPTRTITPIVRSDSSGTTDNFQQYLEAASNGAWTAGAGSDFTGGVGEGAKGSAGVAQAVSGAPGSITYVEKSFADQNRLSTAQIDTGSGPVELTEETAAKAIEGAEFSARGTVT